MGVLRDPAKAAEGKLIWESLGAQLRGEDRLVGTSASRRSAVLSLFLEALTAEDMTGDDLPLIIGTVCHILQFARPYFAVLQEVFHEARRERRRGPLGPMAGGEMFAITCLLPAVWADLSATISGQVLATDASSGGGGARVSTGLSPKGVRRLQVLRDGAGPVRSDVLLVMGSGCTGAARAAMELLRIVPCGVIVVEASRAGRAVIRGRWPGAHFYSSMQEVNLENVPTWQAWFPMAKRVVHMADFHGGADSGVHVSPVSARLEGPQRLASWLRTAPVSDVIDLFASLATIGEEGEQLITQSLGVGPIFVEAADVPHCRRPCLYWIRGATVEPAADLIDRGVDRGRRTFQGVASWQPPLQAFLGATVVKYADSHDPFFAFSLPVKRPRPPERPAGLEACSDKAGRRWEADANRHPPYTYEHQNLVKAPGGPRRLRADEQSLLLGFPPHFLKPREKSSKKDQLEDSKGSLIGNAFPVIIVARLLAPFVSGQAAGHAEPVSFGALWRAWTEIQEAHHDKTGLGWTARHGGNPAAPPSPLAHSRTDTRLEPPAELVQEFLRAADHKGTDVRLDAGMPYRLAAWPRDPLDSGLWTWRVALSCEFKNPQHINILEVTAVFDWARHTLKHTKNQNQRTLILLDSQVAIGTLTKGRSSSRQLNAVLLRLGALTQFANFQGFYGWAPTDLNPADGPSRWRAKL